MILNADTDLSCALATPEDVDVAFVVSHLACGAGDIATLWHAYHTTSFGSNLISDFVGDELGALAVVTSGRYGPYCRILAAASSGVLGFGFLLLSLA